MPQPRTDKTEIGEIVMHGGLNEKNFWRRFKLFIRRFCRGYESFHPKTLFSLPDNEGYAFSTCLGVFL